MKPLQQEEIFAYFKSLSGAKRIELVCGLISMCIPLEIRFFDNVIQDIVKRDYNSFRDAEIKANNFQELDMVCKCDLLSEKVSTTTTATTPSTNMTDNVPYYDDVIVNSPVIIANSTELPNGNIQTTTSSSSSSSSSSQQSNNNQNRDMNNDINNKNNDNGQSTNLNNNKNIDQVQQQATIVAPSSNTLTTTANTNISSNISSFPSRSKLIISLCLMLPSNSQCSTIVFNAIRKQLSQEAIFQAVHQIYLPKNQNIDELFSEILLLLTMAMYHPAFTYEQRDLLARQKKEIDQLYYSINFIRTQQFLACQAVAAAANQQAVPVPAQPMTVTVSGSNATIPGQIVATSSGQPPQSNFHPAATTPTNSSSGSGGGSANANANPQQQSTNQANASSAHIAHQFHHNFHQSGKSHPHHHHHHHHHHNASGGPTPAAHLGPQVAPVATAQPYISFMPSPLGANINYAATGLPPSPISTNATNAVIQGMGMLKMSSPQPTPQSSTQSQQQSSSPSPSSISPASSVSSNKLPPKAAVVQVMPPPTATTTQIGQYIKLDSMYTTAAAAAAGGQLIATGPSIPTPLIVVDPNATIVPPVGPLCLHNTQLIVDDKSAATPSASCYNCGNMGHRGTECTTGTGDASSDH